MIAASPAEKKLCSAAAAAAAHSVCGCAREILSSYCVLNCLSSLTLSLSLSLSVHCMKTLDALPLRERGTTTTRLRLTLRLRDNTLPKPTHEDIFEIAHTKLDCFLTGIRDLNNGGFSLTKDMQSTIDSLISLKGCRALGEINLAPVPSPKITAERTVFIVGDHPAIEIQNELVRSNPNINNIQVHKIKHCFHIIKVVCEDTETADAVIRDGLFAFHTKIAASQCKKEQFTELITCFSCYKYEDHFSSHCKVTQFICSECTQVGHTHRDCMQSKNNAYLNWPPPPPRSKTSIEHLLPSALWG